MIIKSHAKINLAIDILGKDDDGYHMVDNLSIPIDLHDVIEVTKVLNKDALYLTCDDPTIVCDETEHAYEAFHKMKKEFGLKGGYTFQIYKRIPSQSGLGGGSADAAGVILGLCKAFKIPLDDPKVLKIANEVGKNTSFFLQGNEPARLTQEGNIVHLLGDLDFKYYVLLVKPNEGLDAKKVFSLYDELPEEEKIHPNIDRLLGAIQDKNEDAIADNLVNSLYIPAKILDPRIDDILNIIKSYNIKLASISGSGNACFALSKDKKLLKILRKKFIEQGYPSLITSTVIKK